MPSELSCIPYQMRYHTREKKVWRIYIDTNIWLSDTNVSTEHRIRIKPAEEPNGTWTCTISCLMVIAPPRQPNETWTSPNKLLKQNSSYKRTALRNMNVPKKPFETKMLCFLSYQADHIKWDTKQEKKVWKDIDTNVWLIDTDIYTELRIGSSLLNSLMEPDHAQ